MPCRYRICSAVATDALNRQSIEGYVAEQLLYDFGTEPDATPTTQVLAHIHTHTISSTFRTHFIDDREFPDTLWRCRSTCSPAWPPADRLSEYVTETCLVDYGRVSAQESEWLDPVLTLVKKTSPNTDADRHALLINAYNLWTIFWVIRERRYVCVSWAFVADTASLPYRCEI